MTSHPDPKWKPLKPLTHICPDCGSDLMDVTGIYHEGLRRICVGPVRHYWIIPPVHTLYKGIPTQRQRLLWSTVRSLHRDFFALPGIGRADRQEILQRIQVNLVSIDLYCGQAGKWDWRF